MDSTNTVKTSTQRVYHISQSQNFSRPNETIELTTNPIRGSEIAVPTLFGILMFTGVIGNGTLIFTVLRNKSMRNVPNILIVNLSVGDLMLLVFSAPFMAFMFALEDYPFGEVICKMSEYLQTLSLGVSVFTLTALSGDRYVAIVYPMSKHKGNPELKTTITVLVIWILSAVLAIPDAVSYKLFTYSGHSYCELSSGEWGDWGQSYFKAHSLFRFIFLFLIPLIIIGYFYFMIARHLFKSSQNMPCETRKSPDLTQQQQRLIEVRMKVARVVLSFVFMFVVCWLPRHIYLLWYYYDPAPVNLFWIVFKVIGFCLTYVYSCVNPYALYFLSSEFHKYYNRYLFRCCSKDRLRNANSSGISTVSRRNTLLSL